MADLTIIYYTANEIPEDFGRKLRNELISCVVNKDIPIIFVSKKPLTDNLIGPTNNIISPYPRSHISIYRDALLGAKAAKTKYVAFAEDDILYSPEHFKHRSSDGVFAYNLGTWNIHTWGEPLFHHKGGGRKCMHSLICERDLFIEAMEERFAKHPDGTDASIWAEPGRYEKHIGVTERPSEEFFTNPPNIVFIHQTALGFGHLGTRKRLGEFRATEIPYWGKAENIRRLYSETL